MEFKKYQHLERFGTDEVDGIEIGECIIMPKIDGTNASVWLGDNKEVRAGSRGRELSLESDNFDFYQYILQQENIKEYLYKHPKHRLYGEYLVPHSLKTYRDDTWRKFYVFDVCLDKEDGSLEYIPYNIYKPMLEEFDINYIPALAIVKNPDYNRLIKLLEQNNFLIKDGRGAGEGIVLKNYDFYNKYGRQTWAKVITSEFKEKNQKVMGSPEIKGKTMVEERIINVFCTEAFIEKEYAKFVNDKGGWSSKYIPELFGRIYYELVNENIWSMVKQFKNPKVDFKILNILMVKKIKDIKKEIFC